MTEEEYLRDRLDEQQEWHDKKSLYHQRQYKGYKHCETFFIALMPCIAFLPADKDFIRGAMVVIAAVVSWVKFTNRLENHHALWLKYRYISERLKKEKLLYLTRTGAYNNGNFNLLVKNVEKILQVGTDEWHSLSQSEPSLGDSGSSTIS